jgi:hypothetical protein
MHSASANPVSLGVIQNPVNGGFSRLICGNPLCGGYPAVIQP